MNRLFYCYLNLVAFILIFDLNVNAVNICDPKLSINDWPVDTITTNTKLKNGVGNYVYVKNATTLQDCAKQCCDKPSCNLIFFKEMTTCYLVTCLSDELCEPMQNKHKLPTDPVDYLIFIRSVDETGAIIDEFLKNEESSNELSNGANDHASSPNQGINCSMNTSIAISQCSTSEVCRMKIENTQSGECYCPLELSFYKIQGICREYLQISVDCSMYLNDCKLELSEECVPKNRHSKHGTCQCKVGFRRNLNTFRCDPVSGHDLVETLKLVENQKLEMRPSTTSTTKKVNSRRRPLIADETSSNERKQDSNFKSEESLWKEILNELGVDDLPQATKNEQKTTNPLVPTKTTLPIKQTNFIQESPLPKTNSFISSSKIPTDLKTTTTTKTTTTMSTTTTATTTTPTLITDAPNIFTSQLKANAGEDVDVFYPSSSVVLNGTMSKYFADGRIVKWLWSKDDSSPAFGRFQGSNEGECVVYENLVEGIYRFTLKIWSNKNEFSQDTVHVNVHSFITSKFSFSSDSTKIDTDSKLRLINENVVVIELDLEPKYFTESVKENFLTKFEILLQQSELKLNKPKMILLNTQVSTRSAKSRVAMEFLVSEDFADENKTSNNKDLIESDLLGEVSQHFATKINSDLTLSKFQKILPSEKIVRLIKKKLRTKTFIDSLIVLARKATNPEQHMSLDTPPSSSDYLELKINSVTQLTCENSKYARAYNCSNHGRCDSVTHQCICNKYWMRNLFMYYLNYDNDLTNGNNCEWNIPLVITLATIISIFLVVILGSVLKCCLYYAFCCCCCCSKKRDSEKFKKDHRKYNYYLDEEYRDEDFENENEDDSLMSRSSHQKLLSYKRAAINKIKKNLRNMPGSNRVHKYALLEDDDIDLRTQKRRKNPKMSGEDRMGAELKYNDDEDVVYEEDSYRSTPKSSKNGDVVKEYKNII